MIRSQEFKFFLAFLIFILPHFLSAQIDPLADIFVGKQPIWSHAAIDSSAIGYKGRTGMDYFTTLAERKILVHDQAAFLIYDNHFENLSGGFIEKLDLNSGAVLWKNTFDLRNSLKREFVNHFFINSDKQLELLNFRYSYDTLDIFFPLWDNGKMTIRKYDLTTGEQIYKYHSPIEDPAFPLFKAGRTVYSYLSKNSDRGYDCYTNWIDRRVSYFGMAKTKLDSFGRFIRLDATNDIYGRYLNFIPFADIPYLLNERFDTFFRLIHTFPKSQFVTGDTMELSLYYLDSELRLLKRVDMADRVSKIKEFQVISLKNNHISVLGTEYFEDKSYPRQHVIVFNSKGELAEEIIYPARINEIFGKCFGLLKLRNDPGTLILNKSATDLDSLMLLVYKSDGKGNMSLLAELRMKDYYNLAIEGYLEELEDGKILLSGLFRQHHLDISQFPKTERFITALWDFGVYSGSNSVSKDKLNIDISPNPANGRFRVSGLKLDGETWSIKIYNSNGYEVVNRRVLNESDLEISLRNGLPGPYFISVMDARMRPVYFGKLMNIGD